MEGGADLFLVTLETGARTNGMGLKNSKGDFD